MRRLRKIRVIRGSQKLRACPVVIDDADGMHSLGARPVARRAMSLVELLAIVAMIGVLAAVVIVRIGSTSDDARGRACNVQRGNIEIQIQLYFRSEGAWPATNLADLGGQVAYFPEGLPSCPVDGSPYTMDATTHRIVGHDH
jgi:competence protein ComGC